MANKTQKQLIELKKILNVEINNRESEVGKTSGMIQEAELNGIDASALKGILKWDQGHKEGVLFVLRYLNNIDCITE